MHQRLSFLKNSFDPFFKPNSDQPGSSACDVSSRQEPTAGSLRRSGGNQSPPFAVLLALLESRHTAESWQSLVARGLQQSPSLHRRKQKRKKKVGLKVQQNCYCARDFFRPKTFFPYPKTRQEQTAAASRFVYDSMIRTHSSGSGIGGRAPPVIEGRRSGTRAASSKGRARAAHSNANSNSKARQERAARSGTLYRCLGRSDQPHDSSWVFVQIRNSNAHVKSALLRLAGRNGSAGSWTTATWPLKKKQEPKRRSDRHSIASAV